MNNIQTYNQFEPKAFQLIMDRTPHMVYYCTSVNIPGVSAGSVRIDSQHATNKHIGDKIQFQPLIFNFIIDEKLLNWDELFKWFVSYTHPEDYSEYKDKTVDNNDDLYRSKYSDMRLIIPNNQYEPSIEFLFKDCFPVDLTDIILDIQSDTTTNMIATATIEYSTYSRIN